MRINFGAVVTLTRLMLPVLKREQCARIVNIVRRLERQVADPVLRVSLLPTYTLGCMRALISNDYYPALQRPNVELVTKPIDRIVPQGVMTQDQAYTSPTRSFTLRGFGSPTGSS
jgi:cation diffusion facilitator CzcD-associated flavoprotein CzcO